MGFIKTAIIGAAVYAGIKYITKKDPITGQSIVDDLMDRAPEFADKAKDFTSDIKTRVQNAREDIAL